MSEQPRLEFTLENGVPLSGLARVMIFGLLPALLAFVTNAVSPSRFHPSLRELVYIALLFEVVGIVSFFVQRTAREHVLVTPDGIVRTRRLVFEWTRRFDCERIGRVRYTPGVYQLFTQAVGASGAIEFDYGEYRNGRLAIVRDDQEGRDVAAEIDTVLGHPALVTEANDFYARG